MALALTGLSDVADAVLKIINIILKLQRTAEIVGVDVEVFQVFGNIFNASEDVKKNKQVKKEENELYKIMRDYKKISHRIVKPTWEDGE